MAFRKLTTKSNHQGFTKSAGCSQKASPKRLDSGITLQQTIEKLETLDFLLQTKSSAGKNPQAILNQLNLLEKNLDSSEIANIGVTLSSQQQFKMYSNFIENLSTTINLKDSKLSNMILRGLKGCKKAFNCLYTEIQNVSNEKHLKFFEVNKKNSYAQTNFEIITQEKPCSTPEFENLKQLPKAFKNIQLTRISDQLSELFDYLNTINTELPAITAIEHLSQPDRYRPFKTEEAKQVMISELREIKENIENFIQKKRMKSLRIHKEVQTDKEPKNATWVALEIMNEEKELNLLRLRGKYEVVSAEKKKLEEALIKTSSLCSDYEKKFSQLESENIDLTMKAQFTTEKSKNLERRVLELGAVIKKVVTFKGFQKNIQNLNDNLKKNIRKVIPDQGPYVRRPSAYKGIEENKDFLGRTINNKERRRSIQLNDDDDDSGDSLKSFRDKVYLECEKFGADGETSPGRRNLVKWPEGNNQGFIKNNEGKYVRGEISRFDNPTVAGQVQKEVLEKVDLGSSLENFQDIDLEEFIKNSLQEEGGLESETISENQLKKLMGISIENPSTELNPSSQKSSELVKTQEKQQKNLKNLKKPEKIIEKNTFKRPGLTQSRRNSKQAVQKLNTDSSSSESKPDSQTPKEKSSNTKITDPLKPQASSGPKKNRTKNPNITIKSSNPSPIPPPSNSNFKPKDSTTLIPPIHPRNLSQSYNSSLNSLLSNNPSSNLENTFSDKDSFYEEFPNIHLQIPSRKSVQISRPHSKNTRALSRSSVYSHSKQLLDFNFSVNSEDHSELLTYQEDLKNLEIQLSNSFSPQQNEIYQEIQKKKEELKIKQALFSSKYVQCNLWSPQEFMDSFDRIRCKEKYRILLESVFENNNDINLLGPKGRRELANSVKGHSLSKCSGTCEHLKRALNVVQKYRGKLYPLKLIKM